MHVTSVCQGRRRSMRRPLAAVLMFTIAALGGVAHAVGFDEKLKAPMMTSAADFKAQSKSFATRYRDTGAATPAELVTNLSLTKQQFDLSWQLERAINEGRPPDGIEAMGFVSLGNGGYSIDTKKHPEWRAQGERIAAIFNSILRDDVFGELLQRGFRPDDVSALKEYIASHDVKQATRAATATVAVAFQKLVQKFDKAGRPIPDALVVSYWYQSTLAYSNASRAWSEGLLKILDAQRRRVLLSYLSEQESQKSLIPESVSEAIKGTLASLRSPDFEKRLQTMDGDAP
jgi:hypothetical protein